MRRQSALVYGLFSATVAGVVFYGNSWFSSFPLILRVFNAETLNVSEKWDFARYLFTSPVVDPPHAEFLHLSLLSLLTGLNTGLVLYVIRSRRTLSKEAAGGILGIIGGIVGTGCAACGSMILGSLLLSLTGVSIHALPYHGTEIGYLSLLLLTLSALLLIRTIRRPHVCPA